MFVVQRNRLQRIFARGRVAAHELKGLLAVHGLAAISAFGEPAKQAQKAAGNFVKLLTVINATAQARSARLFAIEVAVTITNTADILVAVFSVVLFTRFFGRAEHEVKLVLAFSFAVFVRFTFRLHFLFAAARVFLEPSGSQVGVEFLAVVATARKSFGTRRASFASVSVVALAITEATTPFLAVLEVRLDTCLHAGAEPSFLRAILISFALF